MHARELGMVTIDTADIGGEVLDAIICWRGRCIPFEIKSPGREAQLTEGEKSGIGKLEDVGVTAYVVTSIEEVLSAFDVA